MTPHARPRPRKAAKGKLRKRYARAAGPRRVIFVDLNDPKWADLRSQLADDTPVSDEEEAAFRQWLKTGK